MGHKEEYDLFEGDRLQLNSLNPSNNDNQFNNIVKEKFKRENIVGADKEEDNVNNPKHYISDSGLEVFDVIKAFTDDCYGAEAFCIGNAIKYLCRFKKKNKDNPVEDLKKARWYLDKVIEMWE